MPEKFNTQQNKTQAPEVNELGLKFLTSYRKLLARWRRKIQTIVRREEHKIKRPGITDEGIK